MSGAWGTTVTYDWVGSAGSFWDVGANWQQSPDIGHPVPGIWGYSPTSTVNVGSVAVRTFAGANTLNVTAGSQVSVPQNGYLVVTSALNNAGQITMSAGRLDLGNGTSYPPWTDPTVPITAKRQH